MQRGKRDEMEILKILVKKEKKELAKEIWKAKEKKWTELYNTIDGDVWGKSYKGIIKRVKGTTPPATLSMEFAKQVLEGLFPRAEIVIMENEPGNKEDQPRRNKDDTIKKIEIEEVRRAAKKLRAGKAAGQDGMPPEVIKAIVDVRPDGITALLNGILERGKIPKEWKAARVILLRKEGKDVKSTAAYRPICILNAVSKLLEYIIRDRLLEELGEEKAFHDSQYGFRKGRSTTQAIQELKDIAIESSKKQRYAALLALDIKNAFNSLDWGSIKQELTKRGISKYLIKIFDDYFSEREVIYKNSNEEVRLFMERGVPQSSILGPTAWNLVYDGLLRMILPKYCNMIAFADDVVITAEDRKLEKIKDKMEGIVRKARRWMDSAGLELAEQKTEALMLNCKRIKEDFCFIVGETEIKPRKEVKYLGVTMDSRRNFCRHVEIVTNKGVKLITALSAIMGNNMKTGAKARKLYYMILESVVLYGAPVWEGAHSTRSNKTLLSRTQKIGLSRIISSYKSVPNETLCVLTGIPPWDLKIIERKELFIWENEVFVKNPKLLIKKILRRGIPNGEEEEAEERRDGNSIQAEEREDLNKHTLPDLDEFEFSVGEEDEDRSEQEMIEKVKKPLRKWLKEKAKERTLRRWQSDWDRATVGRCTHELIPDIKKWMGRKHGNLNYCMSQIFTGHGVFNSFRHRLGKTASKYCWYHPEEKDSAEHTMMRCDRWVKERERLFTTLMIQEIYPNKERVMEKIVEKEEYWKAFAGFCKKVMTEKAAEERRREVEGEDEEEEIGVEEVLESGDFLRRRNLSAQR